MNNPNELEKLSESFRALIGNAGLNYQILDLLPIPIGIYTPDGMCVFYNRAFMEFNNIPDASTLIGVYNLKHDPVCLGILGQELMDRIFLGETCSYYGFPIPIDDTLDRGIIKEKPYEAATMDIIATPLWDGGTFVYTVCVFKVKNVYQCRNDIAKAREYIETHYQEKFNVEKTARFVGLSVSQFRRIFKEVASETPLEFYQKIKIEKLQENLLDGNLSIEQAFNACGLNSHDKTFRTLFKEQTGLSPSEYRQANMK